MAGRRFTRLLAMVSVAVGALSGSGLSAVPARAPSLGPPPKKIDVQSCSGISLGHCVADVWGRNFEFKVAQHVVRVGETLTATVTDATDAYGHSWTWGAPTPVYGAGPGGAETVSCSPPMGDWTPGPSSGHCAWKMTEPVERWTAFGATVNPLGQTYTDQDYYAVLADRYLLHGYVRDSENKGVGGARVEIQGPSGDLFTTTNAAGYYDAILKKGIYSVGVVADQKLCATQRTECENPTRVNLVTDKELDFGPPGGVILTGRIVEHRTMVHQGNTLIDRDDPLASVTVAAAALKGGKHYTTVTDAAGEYRLEVPGGAYNVRAVPSGRTDREKYLPQVGYFERTSGTVTQDFRLVSADELVVTSDLKHQVDGKSELTPVASGTEWTRLSITLENARGDPVPETWGLREAYVPVSPATPVINAGVLLCRPNATTWSSNGGYGALEPAVEHLIAMPGGKTDLYVFFGNDLRTYKLDLEAFKEPGASDEELIRMTGSTVKPVPGRIRGLVDRLDALELSRGPSTAALQETVVAWLLQAVGQGRQLPYGDFVPIVAQKSAVIESHTPAAIVFYPTGTGNELAENIVRAPPRPLASGYSTVVLPITWDFVEGVAKVRGDQLMTIQEWEKQYGDPFLGTLESGMLANNAFLGNPYPPAPGDPRSAAFARCYPDAMPKTTAIEVHSPVRVLVRDAAGHSFGYDEQGRFVNELAGFVERERGVATYVVPAGDYAVSLTGTGSAPATVVVRTPGKGGEHVAVFSISSRAGAAGTLHLTKAGAAPVLRFGGQTVRAAAGVGLRVSGVPHTVRAGRVATLRVRVVDQFGKPVVSALVQVTGKGVSVMQRTGAHGKATARFEAPPIGRVRVGVSAPGYATATATIAVHR